LTQAGPKADSPQDFQHIAICRRVRQKGGMKNSWKWLALLLGVAFIALLIFTVLVINGIMEFGWSVL
jgi:hypothetical protein